MEPDEPKDNGKDNGARHLTALFDARPSWRLGMAFYAGLTEN